MSESEGSKGRGCLFYGCVTAIVLLIVGGIATYFGVRYAVRTALNKYTDTKPMALPKVVISAEEMAGLRKRVEAFREALESQKAAEPLVLTSNELNALIANESDLVMLKDRLFVTIEDDQIKGKLSFPLDALDMSFLRGRYFNGAAGFKVSLENGVLLVTLQSAEFKGKPVPDSALAGIRQKNLARDAYKDPKSAERIRKLESIEIKDGKVTIKVRAKEDAEAK